MAGKIKALCVRACMTTISVSRRTHAHITTAMQRGESQGQPADYACARLNAKGSLWSRPRGAPSKLLLVIDAHVPFMLIEKGSVKSC